ncbi:flagellar hook-associated protein FlgK [Pseudoduganella sp. RAF53_2]|uniref:flagellar hook-associated protein FlgK n=1 Tax=unclassified Pseudoduganella TaxID=2637179 RepID=UPI003F9A3AF9
MSLLSIGKSGLLAAQAGLSTTGHNITNANVPGYSRQTAIQSTTPPVNTGVGFIGTGTEVSSIRRSYDDFLTKQVWGAEANQSQVDTYLTQISQIDNLLADSTAGLSPALQDFFKGVQDANSNPSSVASRESMLSSANTLAARFQSLNDRFQEISDGATTQINSTIGQINSYATQIAKLNQDIARLTNDPNNPPNDLLDQRDQLITELNKNVKLTVVQGDNNMLNVSFGTGQPLVVGANTYQLAASSSPTDPSRISVGYQTGSKVSPLPDDVFNGGSMAGLLQFRNTVLDKAQNQLGQIAAGLATSFNAQHKLGQDQNGDPGQNFFGDITGFVGYDSRNSPTSTLNVVATIKDASALTSSDYDLNFDGTNMVLTRASDGQKTTITTNPQIVDGVEYNISGVPASGDHALVRPTYQAAQQLKVVLTDASKIALAAPISTSAPTTNKGTGKIDAGSVDQIYLQPGNALTSPITLDYDLAGNTINGFPGTQQIDVTVNGTTTSYPAGTTSIPYTDGAKITFGGISVTLSGKPADNDTFTIGPNTSGVGDNRNGVLLAGLQSKNILDKGTATFQGSYAQMVNFVGNRAREAQIGSDAAQTAVEQATTQQQNVSGVNLDEEAANLLRYQQAYQAAGKVMQIASTLFDTLLQLGG